MAKNNFVAEVTFTIQIVGTLKSGFDSAQDFLYEPSSHMVYNILMYIVFIVIIIILMITPL